MSGGKEALEEPLELALASLARARGETFAALIRPILYVNLGRSRLPKRREVDGNGPLPDYVQRVVSNYDAMNGYLHELQVVRSDRVWEPLLKKLQQWAHAFLGRWHLDEETRTRYSHDFADQAAVKMLAAHYPYDGEFDGWARIFLHNVCRRQLDALNRSRWFQDEISVDWMEAEEWASIGITSLERTIELRLGLRQEVGAALELLPATLKRVIRLRYFDGLSFAEIAARLEIPIGAVYKRHHDARHHLARLLSK
jgi:RNA polymerase sigma-70 factor (ECF subfamily)